MRSRGSSRCAAQGREDAKERFKTLVTSEEVCVGLKGLAELEEARRQVVENYQTMMRGQRGGGAVVARSALERREI